MIIKPVSASEDIQVGPSADATVLANTLIYIVNTNTTAAGILVAEATPKTVYVPAQGSIVLEKEHGAVIDAAHGQVGITTHVWAQAVAYTN
jgi:hypothetical protein